MTRPHTLFEKIWNSHLVDAQDDGIHLLYIDRHLLHEVLSPQAFEGLRLAGRRVRRRDATLAVADHNVPTTDRRLGIEDPESRLQVETLGANCREFGVEIFDMLDPRQGIVHVIGPEQGFTLPGTTVVCCDSHTATHGAFGALAFGIGTSESEHVLATQTLRTPRPKSMRVTVDDPLPAGCTGKDLILAIIGQIGTAGGTGHIVEYSGRAIRELSMEGRMTVSNMTIEAGARAGLVAPDEKTFAYLGGRPMAPRARNGTPPLRTGAPSLPTRARSTTRRCGWRRRTSRRRSPGARAPKTWCPSPARCRTRRTPPTRRSGPRRRGRWNTWDSSPAPG